MNVNGPHSSAFSGNIPDAKPRPGSKAEAAKQFEEVLVREFVKVMTKDLFKADLSSEGGPSWMGGYSDMQRDIITDTLTEQLVAQDNLGLADVLTRRWGLPAPDPDSDATPDKTLSK